MEKVKPLIREKLILNQNHKVKFKLEYVMEVDDLELLELVNDYQRRSDEPTFNTLDDIPEALMIDALDEANYIEDEINDYMMVEDISISKLAK